MTSEKWENQNQGNQIQRKNHRQGLSDETDEATIEWQNAKESEGDRDREKKGSP